MASSSNSGPSSPKVKRLEVNAGSESEEDGFDQEFDEETQKAMEEIDTIQNEVDHLNEQAADEILRVEQKFNKIRKPLYSKRDVVIRKIPHFWKTTMVHHPQISLLINEDEEYCLQFLDKLEVEEFEDIKSGYRIKLNFNQNPFFENDVLTKEFNFSSNEGAAVTEIRWKENMNLCRQPQKIPSDSSRRRNLQPRSFFSWFTDPSDPSTDEIAETIKDELYSNPLHYFLVPDGVSPEESDVEETSEEETLNDMHFEEEDEEDSEEDACMLEGGGVNILENNHGGVKGDEQDG